MRVATNWDTVSWEPLRARSQGASLRTSIRSRDITIRARDSMVKGNLGRDNMARVNTVKSSMVKGSMGSTARVMAITKNIIIMERGRSEEIQIPTEDEERDLKGGRLGEFFKTETDDQGIFRLLKH